MIAVGRSKVSGATGRGTPRPVRLAPPLFWLILSWLLQRPLHLLINLFIRNLPRHDPPIRPNEPHRRQAPKTERWPSGCIARAPREHLEPRKISFRQERRGRLLPIVNTDADHHKPRIGGVSFVQPLQVRYGSHATLPRRSARLTALPSKVFATNAGAASPFSRCRWA